MILWRSRRRGWWFWRSFLEFALVKEEEEKWGREERKGKGGKGRELFGRLKEGSWISICRRSSGELNVRRERGI